jgi:hypothetical protein
VRIEKPLLGWLGLSDSSCGNVSTRRNLTSASKANERDAIPRCLAIGGCDAVVATLTRRAAPIEIGRALAALWALLLLHATSGLGSATQSTLMTTYYMLTPYQAESTAWSGVDPVFRRLDFGVNCSMFLEQIQ